MSDLELFPDLPRDAVEQKRIQNCLTETLNELLTQYAVSQTELCRATGIAQATISDWVNGKVYCQNADQNLKRVADFFGVTVDYLLFGLGEDPTEKTEAIEKVELERMLTELKKFARKHRKIMSDTENKIFTELGIIAA